MKRVAAGAHIPTPWLFEPAKRPDDTADYCLVCSFFPYCKHQVLVFTLDWGSPQSALPANLVNLEKPDGTSEVRTRDLSAPSLCRCTTLAQ